MSVTLRLNIGSGPYPIPGYMNWDIKDGGKAFPLPFESGTIDAIRASHVLEHLTFKDASAALADWNRVLVDGGEVKIAVPDFDKAAEAKDDPKRLFYVMGGQTDEHDRHGSAFTRETLTDSLTRTGFEVEGDWESEIQDCASLPVSLNLRATKKRSAQPKICVLCNVPRYGFQLHFACLYKAFSTFGIPVRTTMGVYWGQCMTRAIEKAIEDGFDWAFCVDYDSVFTGWHVKYLLDTFSKHPEVHALAPIQTQRQSDLVMISSKTGEQDVTFKTHEPTQVNTAHFGLTLIRLSELSKVAKPWFIATPDGNGGFSDGRVDADVGFWHKWNDAGLNVSVLAGCSIGHLEGKVTHFNIATNQVECDYVGDWIQKHEAWGGPECVMV